MAATKLDERIRELCTLIPITPDEEIVPLIQELQAALHKKVEQLRDLARERLPGGKRR
jgi:hypothetical protein